MGGGIGSAPGYVKANVEIGALDCRPVDGGVSLW
jgi:hypothetical protein